jgi:serine/threonine-protein kinase
VDHNLSGVVLDGKYRLKELLGQGGMGLVYAADHTLLGKQLAVKLLKREFTRDRIAVQRFQQEAVNASRAGSPNIVAIHDLGETDDGVPFIVMEHLEGTTLYAAMAEDPKTGTNGVFEVPFVADILCQVLEGLAAAHAQGIAHRDLKPGNIFLTEVGGRANFVKLLDFGVSKVLGGDRVLHMTRTGVLLGTPTYMAPEQVMGRKDVDHRVDLWASGVILFRLLTGQRPHGGSVTAERLAAIVSQDAPPLRSLRPDLDAGLEGLLRKALMREPARRFQTARDFAEAMAPYRDEVQAAHASSYTLAPPPPVSAASSPPRSTAVRPTPAPSRHDSGPPTVVALSTPPPMRATGAAQRSPLLSGTFEQQTTSMPVPSLPAKVLPVASMGTPTPGAILRPGPTPTSPRLPAGTVRRGPSAATWISAISLVVIAASIAVILVLRFSRPAGPAGPAARPAAAGATAAGAAGGAVAAPSPTADATAAELADRERYIAVMLALRCPPGGPARPADPAAAAAPPAELLATVGLAPTAWSALAARHQGHPETQRLIETALRYCPPPPP